MKKLLFLFGTLLGITACAQDSTTFFNPRKIALGVSMQHLFINGLRLELEIPVTSQSTFLLNPIYYLSDGKNRTVQSYKNDAVEGFGIEIMRKNYLWQKVRPKRFLHERFYVGYGVGYHRIQVSYNELNWVKRNSFYYIENKRFHETVHRGDIFGALGLRYEWCDRLFADISLGPCIRRAFFKHEQLIYLREYKSMTDYHYSGITLRLLGTIGVRF
ncbi:MAG: hypothetical protein NZM38_02670 [Cytophagales bacterium]|nr:hypothetical protein [Cytophagales bacterium]MDW8383657.1 hypothetical protein [Flammeovirgaceae bacterium]